MALSDYQQVKKTIKGAGGSFDVRGLNLDDITQLVSLHLADVEEAFRLYDATTGRNFSATSFQAFILSAVNRMPNLVSEVISIAADEPEMRDQVTTKLPLTVQVDALYQIMALTIEDAGGLKNVWATVRELLVRHPAVAKSLTAMNQNGQAKSKSSSTRSEPT